MIVHDVVQGSAEWERIRLGIPTASEFSAIITPTGKASTQADDYSNRLIAEAILGHPLETFSTKWTERGQDIEQQAVQFYEFQRDIEVQEAGFVTDDAFTMGCSPDRLVGDDGLLEIKCLKASNHVGMYFDNAPDPKHKPQIQGQLLITGRQWCDVVYFHPSIPSLIVRVERDKEYLDAMGKFLEDFTAIMKKKKEYIAKMGISFA